MHALRTLNRSPSPHSASPLVLHTSEMAAAESDPKDVVEAPIDDDTTGRQLNVPNPDSQRYTLQEVWLTSSQVDKVENPLRTIFQIHDNRLGESFRTKTYQLDVRLMAVASPAYGRLDTVSVDSMLN